MKRLAFIAVLSMLVAVPAMADLYGTIDVQFTEVTPRTAVGIWSSNPSLTGGTSVQAGAYNLNLSNVSGVPAWWEAPLTGEVQGFCIDIWDPSSTDNLGYDVLPLALAPDPQAAPFEGMGALRAAYMGELLDTYWVGSLTNLEAAALQVAVWEIVDEGSQVLGDPDPFAWSTSLNSGNFYVGNVLVANRADEMLAAIVADKQATVVGNYVGLGNPMAQDPKGEDFQDYVVRVPVPAAVWLGVLGLSAAGLKLRRRSA